ncbi:MAG TPA: Gmad2 immunoglobulin-like domain-containing protein [Acidimicrobiia bacterium]|nr:Gmad2 immunoglobulin-like domain-containing protein [Acidimicrobiia bacterium]
MKTRILALTAILTFGACLSTPSSTVTTATSPPTTGDATTTTDASTTTTSPPAGCSGEGEFVDDGRVAESDQPSSDAERVGQVSWNTTTGCETFVIELVTAEGAPATTPPSMTADFLREIGVLRIDLEVVGTAITDQLVESGLVDRFYVVRQADGTLFLDLILAAPALARVSSTTSPGAVIVELEPGGTNYTRTPLTGGLFVVTSPGEGAVDSPIPIRGYGRPFEATVLIELIQGGGVVAQATTNSADYVETWGEFSLDLDPDASGSAQLFVGETSADDGSPRGVLIPVELP